jgi:hypothetical protein
MSEAFKLESWGTETPSTGFVLESWGGQTQDPGHFWGAADAMVQGVPILGGLIPKADAAVHAGLQSLLGQGGDKSFWERYDASLKERMGQTKAYGEAHPIASTAAGIGGGVAGMIPAVAAAPAAFGLGTGSLLASTAAGIGSGGAIGGLDAYFRGNDPLVGAGIGAVAGGAAPVLGRAIGAGTNAVVNKLTTPNVAGSATSRVVRAASDDALTLPIAQAKLAQLGPEGMIADLGPNLRGQAGALAGNPGPAARVAQDALTQRALNEDARFIATRAASTASPIYKEIENLPIKATAGMNEILQTPAGKSATMKAIQMAQNERIPIGADVRTMDLVKRGLDDLEQLAERQGLRHKAGVIGSLRKDWTAAIDEQVPRYAEARAAAQAEITARKATEQTFKDTKYVAMQNSLTSARREASKEFPSAVADKPLLQSGTTAMDVAMYLPRKIGQTLATEGSKQANAKLAQDASRVLFAQGAERDEMVERLMKAVERRQVTGVTAEYIKKLVGSLPYAAIPEAPSR